MLAALYLGAIRDGVVSKSPCDGMKLPNEPGRKVEPLAVADVLQVADKIGPRYGALVVLAAAVGLRQGEVFGVGLDTLDMLRRELRVDRQVTLTAGHGPRIGPPKTTASVRTVPLPDVALDHLARHLERYPARPVPMETTTGQSLEVPLVFTDRNGRALSRTRFSDVWRRAVHDAGLPAGTRFHDLRHTAASALIEGRQSVKAVQAILGHATATETLDTYAHLWPSADNQARATIDRHWSSAHGDDAHPRTARGL